MSPPLISVIMPVYNGAEYLPESIESILKQSFIDFEFLIIDDGSTDNTFEIIKKYANLDHRIQAIHNKNNIGIASSLNIGLARSKAPLIARMDADDISTTDRLEKQWNFLKNNPEIDVIGSYYRIYEFLWRIVKTPSNHENILSRLLFDTSFFHPTVMFRKHTVLESTNGYRIETTPAEDYDLWCRLAEDKNIIFSNIKETLLRYRIHPTIERVEYLDRQFQQANAIRKHQLTKLDLYPNEKEFMCHSFMANPNFFTLTNIPSLMDCSRWLHKIENANLETQIYSKKTLRQELEFRWTTACLRAAFVRPSAALEFIQSDLTPHSLTKFYYALIMIWRYIKHRLTK